MMGTLVVTRLNRFGNQSANDYLPVKFKNCSHASLTVTESTQKMIFEPANPLTYHGKIECLQWKPWKIPYLIISQVSVRNEND